MGKIKKKINHFSNYEFEYLESYLEDMARQGQICTSVGYVFLTFEEGEPREIKYRMVPDTGLITDEEKSSYEDKGWKFIGSRFYPMLMKEDPKEEELFADAESYKRRANNFLFDAGFGGMALIFIVIGLLIPYIVTISKFGYLHAMEGECMAFRVMSKVSIAVCGIIFSWSAVKALAQWRRIKILKEVRRSVPYGKRLKINKITGVMVMLALAIAVCTLFLPTEEIEYKENNSAHPVSMMSIDPEGCKLIQSKVKEAERSGSEDEPIDDAEYVRESYKNNLFSVVHYEGASLYDANAEADDEGNISPEVAYYAHYYVAKNAEKAEQYLKEEIKYDLGHKNLKAIEKKGYEADYVGYCKGKDGYTNLYVRKGNVLEIVNYIGDKDLEKSTKQFVDDVK